MRQLRYAWQLREGINMHRHIFQDPPHDVDETWTHGAMLGGMCGYGDDDLAESYFLAGDALIATVISGDASGHDLVNPVMYSYRHGIELYLKCIVQPDEKNHSLSSLLERFCRHIRTRYGESVPSVITKPIAELARYDRRSDVFRYETNRDGRTHEPLQGEGEFWIDLRSVKASMAVLRRSFRRVLWADRAGEIPPPGVS